MCSFSDPVVVLVGGSDKGADLSEFCEAVHNRAAAAILMGETADMIAERLAELNTDQGPSVVVAADFPAAFRQAVALAPSGGIVLLSPGCASYGWFRDFRDRGHQFTEMSRAWIAE